MKTINNNISEDILSFENSKEIVRLGFTIKSYPYSYYNHKGEYKGDITDYIQAVVARKDLSELKSIAAPTIALAVKWIFENYQIWISVDLTDTTTEYYFQPTIFTSNDRWYNDEDFTDGAKSICKYSEWKFNTSQEAYQVAINYTLLNLIK